MVNITDQLYDSRITPGNQRFSRGRTAELNPGRVLFVHVFYTGVRGTSGISRFLPGCGMMAPETRGRAMQGKGLLMTLLFRILTALAVAVGLAACATSGFKADVTRFHSEAVPTPDGQQVTIRPAAGKEQGPEFEQYAMMVGRTLGEIGFLPAEQRSPVLIAMLDWDRRQVPREGGDSDTRIGIGVGSFGGRTGVSLGTSFGLGDGDDDTDYIHEIFLTLDDAETGERLWEGRAVTRSDTSDTAIVVPYLAEALLRDFPGAGGKTVRVEIPIED